MKVLDRRMSLTDLSAKVNVTLANLSILKTGKAKAIRFSTLNALCRVLECQPGYPEQLAASLERQPTELGAWMANRLLNSKLPRDARGAWLRRLTAVASHPQAAPGVRDSAIRFLDFQASRSS